MPITGRLRIRTLEGSPISVGDMTLVPQALHIALGQRRGRVTGRSFGGWAWACGALIPKAVLQQRDGAGKRVPIPDPTGQALACMGIAAFAVLLLSLLVRKLVGPSHSRDGSD